MTDIDGLDLISPRAYGEHGIPHDRWSDLRRSDRLHLCEPPGFDPFYPVVRHEHICEISKQPDLFWSRFGIVLESQQQKLIINDEKGLGSVRVIIGMDPPDHREYRKVAAPWFTPKAVKRVDPVAVESARGLVDRMVERASGGEGECEFASDPPASRCNRSGARQRATTRIPRPCRPTRRTIMRPHVPSASCGTPGGG